MTNGDQRKTDRSHRSQTPAARPPTQTPTAKPNPKPNRNPTGRLLYRQLPPHLTTTTASLQPVITLDRPTTRIIHRYTQATLPSNFNKKITDIDNNPLFGHHFQRIHQNAMIHDTAVHAYLRLIQRRSQGAVKAMDFITIHRLQQGEFAHIDRQFRTKDIFAHDWILFPILKASHFTLIAVRPNHNGHNQILFCDSLAQNCSAEVEAVHQYLQHVSQNTNRPQYSTWEIDMNATRTMDRQQGTVNCGIYTSMIADCITTGVPLAALNNDFIQQCRTRLAHCLLQNKVTSFTQNNIGVRLLIYISEHDDPETEPLSAQNAAAYPHLLSPDYVWDPYDGCAPDAPDHPPYHLDLRIPQPAILSRENLRQLCDTTPSTFSLEDPNITHADFLDLLCPNALDQALISHLFRIGLHSQITDVAFVPPPITQHISSYGKGPYRPIDGNDDTVTLLRQSLFSKPTAVFLFGHGEHFTTVITNRKSQSITYIDSITTRPTQVPREVDLVRTFINDEAARQSLHTNIDKWPIRYAASHMERQKMHRHTHEDRQQAAHKD